MSSMSFRVVNLLSIMAGTAVVFFAMGDGHMWWKTALIFMIFLASFTGKLLGSSETSEENASALRRAIHAARSLPGR